MLLLLNTGKLLKAQAPPSGLISNPLLLVNQQLRDLFTPLYRPALIQEYLYDMSAHVSDDKFWTNLSYDTSNTDNWYRLYWEQFYMAYDTTSLSSDESIYESVLQYIGDTVPIGVLDISYYKFNSKALTTKDYFIFDTINDKISDIVNRPNDPYFVENIFTCAPLYNNSKYGKVTWVVTPSYFFNDFNNSSFYIPGNYDFQIDFGDGAGFRTYNPTQTYYETIDYNVLGIQNEVCINVRLSQDGQIIKHSKSSFILGKTGSAPRAFDEKIEIDDLLVYVYRSCNSTPQNRKIVIYLEGLDVLDFSPKLNRTAQDIYHDMLQVPNISQLSNFGYDFYIVDWANSRIDMRSNAMSVVRLIDALKGEVQNDHEFVIIGESMGGLIARYALTYMESINYLDPNSWPNANKRERMHNCRLMITWDSPHQGANIPLSIQHFYTQIVGLGGNIFGMPMAFRKTGEQFNLFLDGTAAKQLLIYHVDTKYGFGLYKNYNQHSERTSFLSDLAALGNYPQFCKKMAISNGALNGDMQTTFSSFTNRVANDKMLELSFKQSAKILFFLNVPFFGVDIDLRTNPNGQGQIYKMNAGSWGIRLKFYWFGVKLITGYNTLYNKSEFADVNPYCVNAGGYMGDVLSDVIGQSSNSGTEWDLSKYWLFNIASFKSGSDGNGCWTS